MTNESANRRKLIHSIALGGGVIIAGKSIPNSWTKPIIQSVILPAHAQTSEPTAETSTSTTMQPGGCCEIAGTFEGQVDNTDFSIRLVVDASGSISITLLGVGSGTPIQTSVPCSGGSFSVDSSSGTITGTIACNSDTASGNVGGNSYVATRM